MPVERSANQNQRAHKAHQRTVHFVRRPRHDDCAGNTLQVIRNCNAYHNAVLRKPLCGNQFLAGRYDLFAEARIESLTKAFVITLAPLSVPCASAVKR